MVAASSKDRSGPRIERVLCPSRIASVSVYARGAVVTRRVEIPAELSAGAIDLVVEAITPLAEPGSFRVEVEGDREALGVVTEMEIPEDERSEGELTRELSRVRRTIAELSTRRIRWEMRRSSIARTQPVARLATKKASVDPGGRMKGALAAQSLLAELEAELDERVVAVDREISDAKKELARLETEAAQREGNVVRRKHHPEMRALIRLAERGSIRSLALSYSVAEARWWPTYAVHLTDGGRKAELFVDALVAQATHEDWKDVAIALSTADMIKDVRLPELTSLRLGRAQPARRRGFREPPPDLDQLFAAHDEARVRITRRPPPVPEALQRLTSASSVEPPKPFDDDSTGVGWGDASEMVVSNVTRAGTLNRPAPKAAPVPTLAAAPPAQAMMRRAAAPAGMMGGALDAMAEETSSLAEPAKKSFKTSEPTDIEPADAWLDFDSLRMGDGSDRMQRGRLIREQRQGIVAELRRAISLADVSSAKLVDPLASRGEFDHRYEAEGTGDVPANGRAHRVSLARAKLSAKPRFVTVPRKVADVFREVELINPLDAPLLVGPIDVMMDGALLTTTLLAEAVDRGGSFAVGLGVEERVRVARNARVHESTTGILSSGTALEHQVTIELVSGLGHPISVEVMERIPITEDKSVKIVLVESSPSVEPYDQRDRGRPLDGGVKWKIGLDAGAKRTLSFTYRIELPAKCELDGGNRRE
jgi:hypothetical protein